MAIKRTSDQNVVATQTWVNETLPNKRLATDGLAYLFGNADTDGSIRVSIVDGEITYEKRISGTWELATTTDIKLPEYGNLSETLKPIAKIETDNFVYIHGSVDVEKSIRLAVVDGELIFQKRNATTWEHVIVTDIALTDTTSLVEKLASLGSASSVGVFDAGNPITQLNNAVNGQMWRVTNDGTVSSVKLFTGNLIICHTPIGVVGNLDNFFIIGNTQRMVGASIFSDGEIGTVPKPRIADRNKALFGDSTFKDVQVMEEKILTDKNESKEFKMVVDSGEFYFEEL